MVGSPHSSAWENALLGTFDVRQIQRAVVEKEEDIADTFHAHCIPTSNQGPVSEPLCADASPARTKLLRSYVMDKLELETRRGTARPCRRTTAQVPASLGGFHVDSRITHKEQIPDLWCR